MGQASSEYATTSGDQGRSNLNICGD